MKVIVMPGQEILIYEGTLYAEDFCGSKRTHFCPQHHKSEGTGVKDQQDCTIFPPPKYRILQNSY